MNILQVVQLRFDQPRLQILVIKSDVVLMLNADLMVGFTLSLNCRDNYIFVISQNIRNKYLS